MAQQSGSQHVGQQAFREGRFMDAIRQLKQEIHEHPENWDARLYLGMSYYKDGRLQEAESVFRYITEKCPDDSIQMRAELALGPVRNASKGSEQQARDTKSAGSNKPGQSATVAKPGTTSNVDNFDESRTVKKPEVTGNMRKPELSGNVRNPEHSGTVKPEQFGTVRNPEQSGSVRNPEQSGSLQKPGNSQTLKLGVDARKLYPPYVRSSPILSLLYPIWLSFWKLPLAGRYSVSTVAALAVAYAALIPALPAMYNSTLLNPKRFDAGFSLQIGTVKGQEVFIPGPGGKKLHALLFRNPSRAAIVLVNRSTRGSLGDDMSLIETLVKSGASVLIYDYRGFGKSEGQPSIDGLLDDALLAHDYLTATLSCKYSEVGLYGSEVGAGLATEIARQRGCQSLVVEGAFPNLHTVAKARNPIFLLYPENMLPPPLMSLSYLLEPEHKPVFLVYSAAQEIVPESMSASFAQQVTAPKSEKELAFAKGVQYGPVSTYVIDAADGEEKKAPARSTSASTDNEQEKAPATSTGASTGSEVEETPNSTSASTDDQEKAPANSTGASTDTGASTGVEKAP